MMRSFTLLCTATLSVFYLKKKLHAHNYTGIFLNVVGLGVISFADVMNSSSHQGTADEKAKLVRDAWLGLIFITLGQIVISIQVVLEESFMADYEMDSELTAAMMGVWCVIYVLVLSPFLYLLPGNDFGSVENFYNDLVLIGNSARLRWMVCGFMFSV